MTTTLRSVRSWPTMLSAVAVSVVGDQLSTVALAAVFLSRGSAAWVAIYFFVALGMRAAFGSMGGRLADRFDRRRLLIGCDFIRFGLMLIQAACVAADAPLGVLVGVVSLSNLLAAVYRPTFAAWLPELVPAPMLPRANAAEAVAHQIGWIVGSPLGALAVALTSPAVAVVINAVSFLVAALLTWAVRRRDAGGELDRDQVNAVDSPDRSGSQLEDAAAESAVERGASLDSDEVVIGNRVPMFFVVITVATMLVFGAESVLHVLVAESRFELGGEGAGYFVAAIGIGGLVGSTFAPRWYERSGTRRCLVWSALITGTAFVGLCVAPLPVALGLSVLEGVGGMLFEVAFASGLQQMVPASQLGRAFGRMESLGNGAQIAGIAFVPLLLRGTSPGAAAGALGLLLCLVAAVAATTATRTAAGGLPTGEDRSAA